MVGDSVIREQQIPRNTMSMLIRDAWKITSNGIEKEPTDSRI